MEIPGLEIVRFHGRYYIRYHRFDTYFEGLGAEIVASIPADPDEYQKWLDSMRDAYVAVEGALERHVYEIRDDCAPHYLLLADFYTLPSEFPLLGCNFIEYFYIINLDHEILTMNHGIHWRLGNIPRQDNLWLKAIADSIYPYKPTISLDVCSEEHMASPALELPQPNPTIKCDFRVVTPRTDIADPRKAFLAQVLANTLIQYHEVIIRFGREWSPESFPFRELTFALVSISSGQASFHSFPAQQCDPRTCSSVDCVSKHLEKSPGWLDEDWAGERAPLLEFGSMSHRQGEDRGTSPKEPIYLFERVVISLVLVIDGDAITKAVTWGIEQGRANFQIIILSLFEVSFAEVFCSDDGEPFIKVSDPMKLSPLRESYCVDTHPRNRPEFKSGMKMEDQRGELIMKSNCTGTTKRLRNQLPGIAALVNFFEVSASRRAASKTAGILPPELFDLVLDFADYETWKTCLMVSTMARSCCLRKYRVDDQKTIVAGPLVRL